MRTYNFYGKVMKKKYTLCRKYRCDFYDKYQMEYVNMQYKPINEEEISKLAKREVDCFISEDLEFSKYIFIKSSSNIKKNLSSNDIVGLDNSIYSVNHVIHNDNGSIDCFLNNVIDIIDDSDTMIEANRLLDMYNKHRQKINDKYKSGSIINKIKKLIHKYFIRT